MMSLDEQEASSGDAERVSLVIGDLAVRSRGGAEVNLDSHNGHPSPGRVYGTSNGTPCERLLR